jgi:amino acid adenylation domain-containing protein
MQRTISAEHLGSREAGGSQCLPRRASPTNPYIEFRKEDIEQSIVTRFERQVVIHGDRLAIKTPRMQMRYRELNGAANRIAHAILHRLGDREEPVGLLLERDAPLIAGILGALKAGKIYVPLDPGYPRARSEHMLTNSGARMILTDSANFSIADSWIPALNVEDLDFATGSADPKIAIAPERLAYILYTSGSTGNPKGVTHTHRNVLHHAMRYTNTIHLSVTDRLSMLHSPCHIAATHNMYGALLNGASVFPLDLRAHSMAELVAWLEEEQITIYHSVPTVFRHLAEALEETSTRKLSLRVIKLGGDAATRRDFELYQRHFPDNCLLHVTLGSSEVSMFCQNLLDKRSEYPGATVPAGYASPGMEILLLDDDERRVEPGEIGEIVVRSVYLSPGYWRAPELTAAAFKPDPAGGRTYHTGDLGYLLPDGSLVHAGRKDFQVKIRGHRVETAEIEAALLAIDGVKRVAVIARKNQLGEQNLHAYLVLDSRADGNMANMRKLLRQKLPIFMVPASFKALAELPTTENGKVDRRALMALETCTDDGSYIAPHAPVERAIASIWAEVLKLDQIGIHDNFFELGGHSLLATQVLSRVKKTFEIEIPLRAFFESSTVAGLSKLIVQKQAEALSEDELAQLLAEAQDLGSRGWE